MINPYAPPNQPTPPGQANPANQPTPAQPPDANVEFLSIGLLASIAFAGSASAASVLVAYSISPGFGGPLAAFGMVAIVILIQSLMAVQIARRFGSQGLYISQCINGLSWLAVMGVLGVAHRVLPKAPKLNWYDIAVFGSFAFASALVCLLVFFVVKGRKRRQQ